MTIKSFNHHSERRFVIPTAAWSDIVDLYYLYSEELFEFDEQNQAWKRREANYRRYSSKLKIHCAESIPAMDYDAVFGSLVRSVAAEEPEYFLKNLDLILQIGYIVHLSDMNMGSVPAEQSMVTASYMKSIKEVVLAQLGCTDFYQYLCSLYKSGSGGKEEALEIYRQAFCHARQTLKNYIILHREIFERRLKDPKLGIPNAHHWFDRHWFDGSKHQQIRSLSESMNSLLTSSYQQNGYDGHVADVMIFAELFSGARIPTEFEKSITTSSGHRFDYIDYCELFEYLTNAVRDQANQPSSNPRHVIETALGALNSEITELTDTQPVPVTRVELIQLMLKKCPELIDSEELGQYIANIACVDVTVEGVTYAVDEAGDSQGCSLPPKDIQPRPYDLVVANQTLFPLLTESGRWIETRNLYTDHANEYHITINGFQYKVAYLDSCENPPDLTMYASYRRVHVLIPKRSHSDNAAYPSNISMLALNHQGTKLTPILQELISKLCAIADCRSGVYNIFSGGPVGSGARVAGFNPKMHGYAIQKCLELFSHVSSNEGQLEDIASGGIVNKFFYKLLFAQDREFKDLLHYLVV